MDRMISLTRGEPGRQQRAHRVKSAPVGEPGARLVRRSVLYGEQDRAAGHLDVTLQLAQHLEGVRRRVVDGLGEAAGEPSGMSPRCEPSTGERTAYLSPPPTRFPSIR